MLFDIELRTLGIGRSSTDSFKSMAVFHSEVYAAGQQGVFTYSDAENTEQVIVLPTIDLRQQRVTYVSHAIFILKILEGGRIVVGTELDDEYEYPIMEADELKEVFVRFGRGFKGRLYTIKIVGTGITLHSATVFVDRIQLRRR